jgi:DNA replication and repair protein RecF
MLKSARATRVPANALTTLEIWDERLVEIGSQIIDERARLVLLLGEPLREAYQSVAGDDHVPELQSSLSILGESDGDDEPGGSDASIAAGAVTARDRATTEIFRETLALRRSKELERGLTLVGPHRDDVVFRLNALPAKGYASHGETWSFALALKLASAQLLRQDSTSGDPVLILDDVFAELDQARRARLADAVTGFEQVIITAAVLEDIPEALAAHIINIKAGAVV